MGPTSPPSEYPTQWDGDSHEPTQKPTKGRNKEPSNKQPSKEKMEFLLVSPPSGEPAGLPTLLAVTGSPFAAPTYEGSEDYYSTLGNEPRTLKGAERVRRGSN